MKNLNIWLVCWTKPATYLTVIDTDLALSQTLSHELLLSAIKTSTSSYRFKSLFWVCNVPLKLVQKLSHDHLGQSDTSHATGKKRGVHVEVWNICETSDYRRKKANYFWGLCILHLWIERAIIHALISDADKQKENKNLAISFINGSDNLILILISVYIWIDVCIKIWDLLSWDKRNLGWQWYKDAVIQWNKSKTFPPKTHENRLIFLQWCDDASAKKTTVVGEVT